MIAAISDRESRGGFRRSLGGIACFVLLSLACAAMWAADSTVDQRASEFRHKDKPYPTVAYKSKEEWLARADHIRKQILVATGLWPLPERTPLNADRAAESRVAFEPVKIVQPAGEAFLTTRLPCA